MTTHDDPAVAAELSVDLLRWREQFDDLMGRIAGRFARVEPRRRARALVLGLLSGLRRKNCWTIAELSGDATPDGMHHLLAAARWDADAVRDDLRGYVIEYLGSADAVLVVDETGDVKKGTATVILSFAVDHGCDLGFSVVDDVLNVAVAVRWGPGLRA